MSGTYWPWGIGLDKRQARRFRRRLASRGIPWRTLTNEQGARLLREATR